MRSSISTFLDAFAISALTASNSATNAFLSSFEISSEEYYALSEEEFEKYCENNNVVSNLLILPFPSLNG